MSRQKGRARSPPESLARIFRTAWVGSRCNRDPSRRAAGPAVPAGRAFCKITQPHGKLSSHIPVGESPTGTGGSPVPPGIGNEREISGLAICLRVQPTGGSVSGDGFRRRDADGGNRDGRAPQATRCRQWIQGWLWSRRHVRRSLGEGGCPPMSSRRLDATSNQARAFKFPRFPAGNFGCCGVPKWIKMLIGIALLPVCLATAMAVWRDTPLLSNSCKSEN